MSINFVDPEHRLGEFTYQKQTNKKINEILALINYLSGLANGNIIVGNASGIGTRVPLNALPYDLTLVPDSIGNVNGDSGDTTNRFTASSWQQSSGSSSSFGDLFRAIAMHGRAKAGFKFYASGDSAVCNSANIEPYNIVSGNTLTVIIDGGVTQTITFTTGFTSGAATSDEVATIISANITGAQCINRILTNTNGLQISSDTFGTSSTVQVTGGTANVAFGFPTTVQSGINGVNLGDGTFGLQKGWLVCHDKPNNLTSANAHKHMSLEVVDSNGEMQTRLGIEYGLDNTRILISSAQLIVHENPIIISAGTGSNKELWFSKDNMGQQKSRLFVIRTEATTGDLRIIAVNDAGTTDTLMIFDRALSRVRADASIQQKQGSSVARSTTLNPLCAGGNYFVVTGTGTVSYMRIDTWQAGSEIILEIPTGVTIGHNTGGSTPGTSVPFFLSGSAAFVVGAAGAVLKVAYNGSFWMEVCRTSY
jgi:hypothetical protein